MDKSGHQACATCTEWVAKSNRPTIHVHEIWVHSDLFLPGQYDGSKSLVAFEETDLVEFKAGPLQGFSGGRNRSGQYENWIASGDYRSMNSSHRF